MCPCPLLRCIKENQQHTELLEINSLPMQALPYFLVSLSNKYSWKFMPTNSLDGIIRVSTARSKLNHLFVCFFKIFSICTICPIFPLSTLMNKSYFLLQEFQDGTEVALMQVRGKPKPEVWTTISNHHLPQQGPVFARTTAVLLWQLSSQTSVWFWGSQVCPFRVGMPWGGWEWAEPSLHL